MGPLQMKTQAVCPFLSFKVFGLCKYTSKEFCPCLLEEILLLHFHHGFSCVFHHTASVSFQCPSSFLLSYIYKVKPFGVLCVLPGAAVQQLDGCSPIYRAWSHLPERKASSFSPCFPVAQTHPKALLGKMIFMLVSPLQSHYPFRKKFFNPNLGVMPFAVHSSSSQADLQILMT